MADIAGGTQLPCGSPPLPQMPTSIIVALGMAGYFTGVTQTPWTGAIIVMEMIDDHSLILPMLAPHLYRARRSTPGLQGAGLRAMSKTFLRVQKTANLEAVAVVAAVEPKTEVQSLTSESGEI